MKRRSNRGRDVEVTRRSLEEIEGPTVSGTKPEDKAMKWKLIGTAISMAASLAISAPAAVEQRADAAIKKVTVYPDRALVVREARLNLTAGEHSILIENLPEAAQGESFRISAFGDDGIALLGMSHRQEFHAQAPQKRLAELEKQIHQMEKYRKKAVEDRLDAFQKQRELLLAISKSSGQLMGDQVSKGTIAVTQWNEAYKFVGSKLIEVGDSIRTTTNQLDSISNELTVYQQELDALRGAPTRTTKTVQVDMRQSRPGEVHLRLEYVIGGATWVPLYEARLDSQSDRISLVYNAEVTQRTGEDWNNIDLLLSTAVPAQGTGPLAFSPWSLSVVESRPLGQVDGLLRRAANVQVSAKRDIVVRGGRAGEVGYMTPGEPLNDPLAGLNSAVNVSSLISVGNYVTTFASQRKESIPSGDKGVRTRIGEYVLSGEVKYICRPRFSEGVYRLAEVTNISQSPIMSGRVAIFVGSDFMGNATFPSLIVPGEKFNIPFGRDNAVKVERRLSSEKSIHSSDKVKTEATIKLVLANKSKDVRMIDLEEPLPVSKDSRVKVTLGSVLPKPDAMDDMGKATWKLVLAAEDSTVVSIPYRIEHAADLIVAGK